MVRSLLVVVLIAGFAGCGGGGAQPANALVGDTSRGSVRVQLGDTSATNLASTLVRANDIGVTFYDPATGTRAIDIGGWFDEGNGSFHKRWLLVLGLLGELAAGKVFSLDTLDAGQPSGAPDTASMIFQGEPRGEWIASGGAVTVQSLESLRATFSFDAVTLVPRDATAIGTFTMTGTFTIADINDICGFCPG